MALTYQNGVMPTNEWFEKIKAHVDFKGKEVIDVGCAEGIMCKLAMEAGAKQAFGIDNQEHFVPSGGVIFYLGNIEDKVFHGDIKIFSMIIHWLGKDKFLQQLQSGNEIIVIFRLPNNGYQEPINGKWFPTEEELDQTMSDFTKIHSEELMEQDNGKKIRLCIYDRKKG